MGQSSSHQTRGLKHRQSTRSLPDVASGNRLIDEDARWTAYANGYMPAFPEPKPMGASLARPPPENRTFKNNLRQPANGAQNFNIQNIGAQNLRAPKGNPAISGNPSNPNVRGPPGIGTMPVQGSNQTTKNPQNFLNFERNYLANCPPTVPPRRVGGPRSFDGNFTRHGLANESRPEKMKFPGPSDRYDDCNWSDVASDMYRLKKRDGRSSAHKFSSDRLASDLQGSCSKMNNNRSYPRKSKPPINGSGSVLSRVPENSPIQVDYVEEEENEKLDYYEDEDQRRSRVCYEAARSRDQRESEKGRQSCRSSSQDKPCSQKFGSKKSGLNKSGSQNMVVPDFKTSKFKEETDTRSPMSDGFTGSLDESVLKNLHRDLNCEHSLRVSLERKSERDSKEIECLNRKIDQLQQKVESLILSNSDEAQRTSKSLEAAMDFKEQGETYLNLLARVEDLERENKRLEMNNRRQKLNYDRCLEEIAGRVAQAVVNEKTLKSECVRLQKRVLEIEWKNKLLGGQNCSQLMTPIKNSHSQNEGCNQNLTDSENSSLILHQENNNLLVLGENSAFNSAGHKNNNLYSLNLNHFNFDSTNNFDFGTENFNFRKKSCNASFRNSDTKQGPATGAIFGKVPLFANGNKFFEDNEYAELLGGSINSLKDQTHLDAPSGSVNQSVSPVSNGGEALCSRPASFNFDAHSLASSAPNCRPGRSFFPPIPSKDTAPNQQASSTSSPLMSANSARRPIALSTRTDGAAPVRPTVAQHCPEPDLVAISARRPTALPSRNDGAAPTRPIVAQPGPEPDQDQSDEDGATPVHSPNKREIAVNLMQLPQSLNFLPYFDKTGGNFLATLLTSSNNSKSLLAHLRQSFATNDDGYSTMSSAVLMDYSQKFCANSNSETNSVAYFMAETPAKQGGSYILRSSENTNRFYKLKKSWSDSLLFVRNLTNSNRKGRAFNSVSNDFTKNANDFCVFGNNDFLSEHNDLTEVERDLLLFENFDSRREGLCEIGDSGPAIFACDSHKSESNTCNFHQEEMTEKENNCEKLLEDNSSSNFPQNDPQITDFGAFEPEKSAPVIKNQSQKAKNKRRRMSISQKSKGGKFDRRLNESVCTTSSCTSDDSEYAATLLMRERWNQLKIRKAGSKTGVVRYKPPSSRAIVINKGSSLRSCVYNRFGHLERNALTSFDFLARERSRPSTPCGPSLDSSSRSSDDSGNRRRPPTNQKTAAPGKTKKAPPGDENRLKKAPPSDETRPKKAPPGDENRPKKAPPSDKNRPRRAARPSQPCCEGRRGPRNNDFVSKSCESINSAAVEEVYENLPYHRLVRTMSDERLETSKGWRPRPYEWGSSRSSASSRRHSFNGGGSTPSLFLSQLDLSAARDRTFSSSSSLSVGHF